MKLSLWICSFLIIVICSYSSRWEFAWTTENQPFSVIQPAALEAYFNFDKNYQNYVPNTPNNTIRYRSNRLSNENSTYFYDKLKSKTGVFY